MVIYGGQDLREGPQSGMWYIEITQFDQGEWEEVKNTELTPLCRHTAIIKNDLMYIFGGSDGHQEFNRAVLTEFVRCHEFSKLLLVQALRQFLWSFR